MIASCLAPRGSTIWCVESWRLAFRAARGSSCQLDTPRSPPPPLFPSSKTATLTSARAWHQSMATITASTRPKPTPARRATTAACGLWPCFPRGSRTIFHRAGFLPPPPSSTGAATSLTCPRRKGHARCVSALCRGGPPAHTGVGGNAATAARATQALQEEHFPFFPLFYFFGERNSAPTASAAAS